MSTNAFPHLLKSRSAVADSQSVTISLERPTRTGNSAGGKVVTHTPSEAGLRANRRFYQRRSLFLEEVVGRAGGPGIATRAEVVYIFHRVDYPAGWPEADRDWEVVEADGTRWKVLFVRRYEETMQIDCERVK